MTDVWAETKDGGRYWPKAPRARWRYGPTRGENLQAWGVDGERVPASGELMAGEVERSARHIQGLAEAGATKAEQRMLLAIAAVESSGRQLPVLGDYRNGEPKAVGIYQFWQATAEGVGATWDELARSEPANHKAALRPLRSQAKNHRGDMPTLGAIWNAGSVRPSTKNTVWGVVTAHPDTLTKYVAAWNAAEPWFRDDAISSAPKRRKSRTVTLFQSGLAIGAAVMLGWAIFSPKKGEA